jgi:uncharacterized RDD family membrane protein YckC
MTDKCQTTDSVIRNHALSLSGIGMPVAVEMLFRNSVLRVHWMKRVGAAFADMAVIFIPVWAIAMAFGLNGFNLDVFAGIVSGACWFLYSTACEYEYGYTLGKKLASLRVSSEHGDLTLYEAAVRNVSKLFWFIMLPLDVLIGLLSYGDPRQRFTDRFFQTTVVSTLPASSLIHFKVRQPGTL